MALNAGQPKETITIEVGGEEILLLKEKCIYISKPKWLVIADLHAGKITHFRKNGFPIPKDSMEINHLKINKLIEKLKPEKIVFLGDFFHAEWNQEWNEYVKIKNRNSVEFHLIVGNHDRWSSTNFQTVFDSVSESLVSNGIFFSHDFNPVVEQFQIFGHVHTGVQLIGKAGQSLRMPCFSLNEKQLILPAFGCFTGMMTIKPEINDRIFVCSEMGLFEFNLK